MPSLTFDMHACACAENFPFIPQEKHIDQLIYSAGKKMGTVLQLIRETAMRIGEVCQLRWENIDSEKNRIILNNPEKRGTPRIFKVSSELMSRILALPRKSERVFRAATRHSYEQGFLRLRKRLARQLNKPALLKITFHTIRHWKATMLYHQTKDILYVMRVLGHKDIKNTLIYIDLEHEIFQNVDEDQFITKVARTPEEACKLREVGFEKFDEFDGAHLYCKRK